MIMELNNSDLQLNNFQTINEYFIPSFLEKKIVYIVNSNLNYQESFITHLRLNCKVIDLKTPFNTAVESPYFLFDQHWNDRGRDLVSSKITEYIKKEKF